MKLSNVNNLENAAIDDDSLDLLITAFKLYEIAKLDNNVYRKDDDLKIIRHLIKLYYKLVNPNYNNMIFNFRRKYISNELLVEKNDTPEERQGLNLVYDYIQNFDIESDYFNIFVTALQIHALLYKPIDDKNKAEIKETYGVSDDDIDQVKIQKFGGQLRTGTAVMNDFLIDVPDAKEARNLFNQYLNSTEYEQVLQNPDIFAYIDYVVNTTCDLIGMQPFGDGNKRTFRSLLNLMFKKRNLPPVYIKNKERKIYHQALEKALTTHDYTELDGFYYYKICDSIYELDFKPFLDSLNDIERESSIKK